MISGVCSVGTTQEVDLSNKLRKIKEKGASQMKKLTDQQQKEILDTIDFVTQAHRNQFRKKTGLPYIAHPMSVLNTVCRWGIVDDVVFKAALAHDVLEDCEVTSSELATVIGQEATKIVEELTFTPNNFSTVPVKEQKDEYMKGFKDRSVESIVIKFQTVLTTPKTS